VLRASWLHFKLYGCGGLIFSIKTRKIEVYVVFVIFKDETFGRSIHAMISWLGILVQPWVMQGLGISGQYEEM
jgi:hypothetical protein